MSMTWQAISGCPCTPASVAPRQLPKAWMEEIVIAAEQDFPSLLTREEAELMAAAVLRQAAAGGAAGGGGSGGGSGGASGGAKAH